jgi:hypothetical protein
MNLTLLGIIIDESDFSNRGTADGLGDWHRKSKGQTRDHRSRLKNNVIPPLTRVCLRTSEILPLASFLRKSDNMLIGQDT